MSRRAPITKLPTHDVENQPPPFEDCNLFDSDTPLREAVEREGAGWAAVTCSAFGQVCGSAEVIELGTAANRFPPELLVFDRWGQRIDEVAYHPAYHRLVEIAVSHRVPTIAWTEQKPGSHVTHAALQYLLTQAETGVACPMAMSYAVVPALKHEPDLAREWLPGVFAEKYDARMLPVGEKRGVTFGMAMTEKQGGSDVRSNSTRATPSGSGGSEYLLTGHKWFCSAPMSDAFLMLARTSVGLTCFLVPRFRPDGSRNNFFIQRLKDKLGNRSNASVEIELLDTWASRVGEEGRGIATILEMVQHTRLDASVLSVGIMRQALTQALHHTAHRSAFGKRLRDQPLMKNVLADLALEVEAGVALALRVARAFDEATRGDENAQRFARIATPMAKYWLNKRAPQHVAECLECLGGAGYVEESMLPRLYREAPLNGIWEGSGNVVCLDVVRAIERDPECVDVLFHEIEPATRLEPALARRLEQAKAMLRSLETRKPEARRITEELAILLQGALLSRSGPPKVAEAFCRARADYGGGLSYGTLPREVNQDLLLERAWATDPTT
jgi:putative acyl-CoA dehydrogenase